ncbi:MAG: DUF4301 family protein [Bacteroidota bacterium]
MFSETDLEQIQRKGMKLPAIEKQIEHFINGFPFINLARPALANDGIVSLDEHQLAMYHRKFEESLPFTRVVRFVPASGAASRMFKHLFEFATVYSPGKEGDDLLNKDQGFNSVFYFIHHIEEFAFYLNLSEKLEEAGNPIAKLLREKDYSTIIDFLLGAKGLDYSNLPKALLKFHDYPAGARTAAEEHLVEAAEYTRDSEGISRIHFTISPEHQQKFLDMFDDVKAIYEYRLGVQFEISYSIQKPASDIIAVDEKNNPVRDDQGRLLFRPGGHGALIDNLNDIDADIIFVKNIDNIVPDRLKATTFQYKKVIGGYLISLKTIIDNYLVTLNNGEATPEELSEIARFSKEELFLDAPHNFESMPFTVKTQTLFNMLNRPVRICGMVKNEGEPGGGPFLVSDENGNLSLQIVESSQINLKDPEQKAIVNASTHFNPVDLVCATRDFLGNKFNLKDFIDENTGFISLKSSGGKTLKAQELPGLWNGAMARWITIFVEVPIITFNPVKTVNDLLRDEHRCL